MSSSLVELAREVRGLTLRILESADDDALLWVPPGLNNHILWRSGHALWAQDVMCIGPLCGASELPPGWADTFGQDGRLPSQTLHWPSRFEMKDLLTKQLDRLLDVLPEVTEAQLSRSAPPQVLPPNRTLGGWIIHGLHDESIHSGESYFALKLFRARKKPSNSIEG